MALVFNGLELGAIVLGDPDRQPGHAGGRVDLVRGPPAASGIRRARPRLLLRLMPSDVRVLRRPAAVAGPGRRSTVVCLWVDLHFFARGREPSFREGVDLEHRLAGVLAARRGRRARALRRRRRDHLHDRLLHRALAVARQPVRVPAAVLVLRDRRGVPGAAAVLGHRGGARAARPGDPRRRRADRAVPLRHLRARRAAARARLPDPPGRRRERRPGQEPDRAAACASSSRSRPRTTAATGS